MKKFQCQNCGGIVATDFDDELVSCGHCESACRVPTEFGPGVVIDDFAIVQLVGQGGMGNVYLAHQFSLDRQVALKILKSKYLEDPKFKEEFINEARSVASLNHPNIIRAFKVGFEDGRLFFAMEFVEGQNLNDILKQEGAIDQERVIDIAIDTVEALG
jgi:eukaryotic-like serine/threonine-protein kinase